MHGTFTTRSDDTPIDLSWIDWEIVVVGNPESDAATQYRVTANDRDTSRFIGSVVIPAGSGGEPPVVTTADIVELIGGYRVASIYVQIESERLARVNRRICDGQRRRGRAWLRSVPNSVLAEHGIEPDPRRRVRS